MKEMLREMRAGFSCTEFQTRIRCIRSWNYHEAQLLGAAVWTVDRLASPQCEFSYGQSSDC